jgi:hypothetical protein
MLFDASTNHHAMAKDFCWNISKMNSGIGCDAKGWVDPAPIELMCDYPAPTAADKALRYSRAAATEANSKG